MPVTAFRGGTITQDHRRHLPHWPPPLNHSKLQTRIQRSPASRTTVSSVGMISPRLILVNRSPGRRESSARYTAWRREVHIVETNLRTTLDDAVRAAANEMERVLVTYDVRALVMLARRWADEGLGHAGILLAQGQPPVGDLLRRLHVVLKRYEAAVLRDTVRFIRTQGHVRGAIDALFARTGRGIANDRTGTQAISGKARRSWWARQGSNPRPPRCKRGALPLSYSPAASVYQYQAAAGARRGRARRARRGCGVYPPGPHSLGPGFRCR
jgi:hypothetical protein